MAEKEAKSGPEAPFNLPRRVGNYEVVSKIGEGGMGSVYKARHAQLESFAAVKFLTPSLAQNDTFVKRFEREARLAAQLTSPFSIHTFDVGEVEGVRFILMEYVEGESLSKTLERRGKLPEKEALAIVLNVAQALQEAHEMGIIHRDIKPENIMINRRGLPKLADLGIAKQLTQTDQNLTMTGFAIGTPSFMSPEQAQGLMDVDTRSDIYSLGATLYRMVVGALPFNGPTPLSVMHRIATEPPPNPSKVNPSLSPMVSNAICKMMATRREDRYQTIGEVIRQLEAVRSGEPAPASPEQKQTTNIVSVAGVNAAGGTPGGVSADAATTPGFLGSTKAAADKKRKMLVAGAIGGVVVVLGGIVGYVALKGGGPTPTTTVATVPTTLGSTPGTTAAPPPTSGTPDTAPPPPTTPPPTTATTQPKPVTTLPPPPPPTTLPVVVTTTVPPPKPTTTTLPDYTPAVSAVLGQVGRKDWVGAAEAAAQLSARSGGRDAHEKLLAIVRCGVQAGDERAKARELFLGKVSPEFEAADKRLGEAQKRVAAVDPAKLSAAPFDALKAELDGARNDFTAVIKSEQTKATEAQKAALETTSALNAARNADWKAAGEAADRALAIPAANKPALQRLKEVAASGAKATTLRTEAAQKLPAELKNAEAFKAAEAKYRGALEKLGGLNAATLDAAQLDPVLAALDESPAAYRKLLDEGRKLEEQKAQLERDIRARLAEVLAAARDGDWDGAAKAATQLTTLSKNAPAHARLMTAAQAGLRAAGEREQTRKLFAGKTSPEFNAAEARLADTQKRLAALDAAKLDAAPLDALTAELDGARNAFAEVTRVEKQKATEAQKLALETTTALNAARNGDWKSAADAAERANAIAKGHPAQAKLKEVAAAGLKLAELRAEADQKLSPETKAAEPYAAVENKYRALLDRLGGLDASKLDAALLEPALTGLADAQGAYQKLIRDEAARGEVTVRVARELRTGLAAAREGDWKGYSEAVGRAAGLGGAATMMQKLRDIGEAGAQTATARAMAMRFAVGGKVPSSAIAPDTRFSDARERIGALNASKLDTAAVDKLLADLRECRDQFRKAASEFFTAAYPNLAKPIQGTNLVPGLTELHDAQQRCPELPEVIDLAAKYDPRGENLAIIGELLKAKQQARDYAGPDEAARVRKSLDDAVTRCDRLAADAFYRESVSVLRRRLVRARAIASDAAGNPAGMLADAWVLQQAGEESARLLVDRAVQSFMEKLAVGIERDPKSVVKMLESAGAELGPEACAPARKMLTDTLVASKLAQRVFGDRTLTRLWVQQIGPVSPPGMTRVPPGAFPLGQEYKGLVSLTPSYAPEHEVAVAVFYIDVTEVTNEMYQQFVDAGGYGTDAFWAAAKGVDRAAFVDETGKPGPIRWQNGRFPEGEGKMPVTGLSWYEASAYAAWAGKMLPTEVQWECAAVGTPPKEPGGTYTDSVYPWGNKWIKGHAQVDNTKALPVGSKSDDKSPVGCLDMAGNVREWTASPYEKYVNSVSQDKDLGAGLVVVRGASYKESSLNAQAAVRRARAKETRDDRIGFRCVWLPPAVER